MAKKIRKKKVMKVEPGAKKLKKVKKKIVKRPEPEISEEGPPKVVKEKKKKVLKKKVLVKRTARLVAEEEEAPTKEPEAEVPDEPTSEAEDALAELLDDLKTATEVEESTDESVEMISAQEADEIIEEKISPVDKSAEILKQPELGPDAHEREGVGCPKCGMMNEPDSWYCEKCGAELLVEGTG